MMDKQCEARARSTRRPFEHLLVAIRVSKGGDWSSANERLDADRLALFVVYELYLGQLQKQRLSVADFVLQLAAAANDLLGRNAVAVLGEATHELDAAARDNERLEPICAQVREQFEHRLVNHLCVEPSGLRMSRGTQPILHDLVEVIGGHARVRSCHH